MSDRKGHSSDLRALADHLDKSSTQALATGHSTLDQLKKANDEFREETVKHLAENHDTVASHDVVVGMALAADTLAALEYGGVIPSIFVDLITGALALTAAMVAKIALGEDINYSFGAEGNGEDGVLSHEERVKVDAELKNILNALPPVGAPPHPDAGDDELPGYL